MGDIKIIAEDNISNTSAFNLSSCAGNCTHKDDAGVSLNAEYEMTIVYVVIGCVGMCGNSLVVGVILSSAQLRKATTNVFITNQSAIDFSVSLFIVLTSLIRNVHTVSGVIAKELFCRLWMTNLPIWGLFVSSTYNLLAITLERYSAIVHPMRHNRQCSKGKARFALVFPWLWGLGYNIAYMVPSSSYKNGQCTVFTEWPSPVVQTAVGLLTILIQYFIPLAIIAFSYIRIVFVLMKSFNGNPGKKHKRSGATTSVDRQNDKREQLMMRARKNVVKTLIMVSLSFVLCWSPNQIIYTMFNLGATIDFNGAFYHFTVIAVFVNCCINPFIYALKYDQFKNVLFKMCRKIKEDDTRSQMSGSLATSQSALGTDESSTEPRVASVSGQLDDVKVSFPTQNSNSESSF